VPALRIYLDADGLLDLVATESPTDNENRRAIGLALSGGSLVFVTSEITLLEALVHALRDKDEERQAILREFLTPSSFIETRPVSLQIIEDALLLRVQFGLKSPDAIHVATGVAASCSAFLTKDEKWGKLNLSILTAKDLVGLLSTSS
jgi:predicted nucleic acid-binding protein